MLMQSYFLQNFNLSFKKIFIISQSLIHAFCLQIEGRGRGWLYGDAVQSRERTSVSSYFSVRVVARKGTPVFSIKTGRVYCCASTVSARQFFFNYYFPAGPRVGFSLGRAGLPSVTFGSSPVKLFVIDGQRGRRDVTAALCCHLYAFST
jgi:hypothetical protein